MFVPFYLGVLVLMSVLSPASAFEGLKVCRQQKVIMFILDTSVSVLPVNFPKELVFVNSVIDLLSNDTIVGVFTFSESYRRDIKLSEYTSKEHLKEKVSRIGYTEGGATNIHLGILAAREEFFRHGEGDIRDNATHIIICVTDGEPTDDERVIEEVNITRNMGIDIIAIGVGKNLRKGLEITASKNSSEYIYAVDSFDNLTSVVERLGIKPCFSAQTEPVEPKDCVGKRVQIVFILDRSLSVGKTNFEMLLNITKNIVNFMDIGKKLTEIALLTYSSAVETVFTFDTYTTKAAILEAVANVTFRPDHGTLSVTEKALETVNKTLFARDDPTVARVVITITDAKTQQWSRARAVAESLKERGVFMFAVGIGNVEEKELIHLATNAATLEPSWKFVYLYNADYGNETLAETLLQNVAKVSCFR